MAERHEFSWRAAFSGAMAGLLLLVIIGAAIVYAGLYPVAATSGYPPGTRWAFETAMRNAVRQGAEELQPPPATRVAVLEGGSHFKGMCQQCHGGPDAKPEVFATAMEPHPPDLSVAGREWSRSEIFWIAKHGIKMTGMPAFGRVAPDDELWKIAAFVDALPAISASEYAALPNAHADDGAHAHADEGAGHSH